MKLTRTRLVDRLLALSAVSALACGAYGCSSEAQAGNNVAAVEQHQFADLAKKCGINVDCSGPGLAEGNASISGVASVDAFFGSVVNFDVTARATAAGIKAQVDAIRADFGIAADADLEAELSAQFEANLQAGFEIKAQPAKCAASVEATLEAQAKCDADFDPGMASVECKGTCEAEVGAELDCGAEAELKCTFTDPMVACGGSCNGSCEIEVNAEGGCEGTCEGGCEGTCSLRNADGSCAGKCEGQCTGSCKAELSADAMCMGKCEGECSATPPGGECSASAKASCKGSATAMVECSGKCEGDFEPPMAKAECQASAKADAKVNVECTPPSVSIDYELKAVASAEVAAQVRFEAALKTFANVRLPALLASLEKAGVVVEAGAGLAASATGAVNGAVEVAADGDVNVKQQFGLACALTALGDVGSVVSGATGSLNASIEAAGEVTAAVGL